MGLTYHGEEPSPYDAWLGPDRHKLDATRWQYWNVNIPAIEEGARWIFESRPQAPDHRSHRSAVDLKHSIHEHLESLEREGLVEWCDRCSISNLNPFGAVRKTNGDVRILVGPSITGVIANMIILPLHLPSSSNHFQSIFKAAGLSVEVIVYVVDYLPDAKDGSPMSRAVHIMDLEAALLGLEFNADEDVGMSESMTQVVFVNSGESWCRRHLSASRKEKGLMVSFRAFSLYQGSRRGLRLSTLRWGHLFLQHLYDVLYSEAGIGPPSIWIHMTGDAWCKIEFWFRVLQLDSVQFGDITRSQLSSFSLLPSRLVSAEIFKLMPAPLLGGDSHILLNEALLMCQRSSLASGHLSKGTKFAGWN